jgi:hypothetical protein
VSTRAEPRAGGRTARLSTRYSAVRTLKIPHAHFLLIATLLHRPPHEPDITHPHKSATVDILCNRTSSVRATILNRSLCSPCVVVWCSASWPRSAEVLDVRRSSAVPGAGSWLREFDGATRRGRGSKMHLCGRPCPAHRLTRPVSTPLRLISAHQQCVLL